VNNIKGRLHMHNHSEPNGRAYIIGEKLALKSLGEALIKASHSVIGLENIELYTSDGHKYKILITCDVSENEWQELPVPYDKNHDPQELDIVKTYDEVINNRSQPIT
jgi:hypothetical protein